ncbi:hypothetical protein PHYBOEH_000106 [Phytophthora boehmeriae]|uniref:Uncharacterized protein n=1 Tax=Phytophthora boehmeriae TaxID=109152 RepID=A0A8T1XDP4_9STRA|nr:hypothetical protein PHYBOEH_000106 [Phytophthora boehmeriae]
MDELRILLRDAEDAQGRTLGAIADDPAQVSRLKDPVLLLLDVLSESEAVEARHETLQVLTRLFAVCSAHFHDVQAFQEAATAQGGETRDQHSARRGNAVLKALLASLNALSRRDPVDDEAVHTLVEMTRDLCLQSMNAADVVALFDFLRLGRPPARRLVLQMQKSLMEMDTLPRAIFTMRGPSAGLTVPADQPLFTKRGYSCSFGVCLDSKKTAMALFSFRGQNGQGVSAMLDGEMLVIKMSAAQGAIQQVEVPFAEHRARMEKEWVHLCIVHAKKMVFKDKLTVYVDGKAVFNGNMGYPDPVYMKSRNCIGLRIGKMI